MNKFLFSVYRLYRSFFVGVYYYFFPPWSLVLTFGLPMIFRIRYKKAWVLIMKDLDAVPIITPDSNIFKRADITHDDFVALSCAV